jgi:hypothetical protein
MLMQVTLTLTSPKQDELVSFLTKLGVTSTNFALQARMQTSDTVAAEAACSRDASAADQHQDDAASAEADTNSGSSSDQASSVSEGSAAEFEVSSISREAADAADATADKSTAAAAAAAAGPSEVDQEQTGLDGTQNTKGAPEITTAADDTANHTIDNMQQQQAQQPTAKQQQQQQRQQQQRRQRRHQLLRGQLQEQQGPRQVRQQLPVAQTTGTAASQYLQAESYPAYSYEPSWPWYARPPVDGRLLLLSEGRYSDKEVAVMQQLLDDGLLEGRSPREVKRLINQYRLAKMIIMVSLLQGHTTLNCKQNMRQHLLVLHLIRLTMEHKACS